jgi:hypothetical protein
VFGPVSCRAERAEFYFEPLCFNLPRPATYPRVAGVSTLAVTNKSLAQMNKSPDVAKALSKKCTL